MIPSVALAECGDCSDSLDISVVINPQPSSSYSGGGFLGGHHYKWTPDCGLDEPDIYGITITNISDREAFVSWYTNKETIGQSKFWGSPMRYTIWTKEYIRIGHEVRLDSLKPDTTYILQIVAKDRCNNIGISGEHSFTTAKTKVDEEILPIPKIKEPKQPDEPQLPSDVEDTEVDWLIIGTIIGICALGVVGIYFVIKIIKNK